jgi:hypothetical protein
MKIHVYGFFMKKLITTGIKKQIQTSLKNRKGEERPDRENNEKNAHFYLEIYAGKRHKGGREWKMDFPRRKDW